MKQKIYGLESTPTANIAVNKSRVKLYNKNGETPTCYLQDGQEFQIEIFNPTTEPVLAKITLNNKLISQGGLVLNPGQRVFLDRYLDVAKKFKFETYEVSNTNEVKKAIKNNGNVKIEFFKENIILNMGNWAGSTTYNRPYFNNPSWSIKGTSGAYNANLTTTTCTYYNNNASLTSTIGNASLSIPSNKIETGRVGEGSESNQKFQEVNNSFSFYAFHTVEYKLLPVSQKINTADDLNVKVYCTNCGTKLGKGHKFCSSCGTKA
jgi:hypothetical protein